MILSEKLQDELQKISNEIDKIMLNKKFRNSNRNYFSCVSDYDYYIIDISRNNNFFIDKYRSVWKSKRG